MNGLLPPLHIARRLTVWLVAATAYVLAVEFVTHWFELPHWSLGSEAAATISFALGILLVFRTTTAYERWWEARKHWGQLVNDSRNLALKARAHAPVGKRELQEFDRLLIAFPHALRLHLRGIDDIRQVPGFVEDESQFPHPPGYIAGLIYQKLNRWNREGKLLNAMWVFDVNANSLMDICGACERIRNTPIAASYRSIVRLSILAYVLIAPWSMSLDAGWSGFPILEFALLFVFGVELVAEVIEEPFGTHRDDLPLERYCDVIQDFVEEAAKCPVCQNLSSTTLSLRPELATSSGKGSP